MYQRIILGFLPEISAFDKAFEDHAAMAMREWR